ncbi:MAG TPA: shikimate dehydrogenase [Gemmatimonadaceae bacterium]|nr:shikimate dehydrogenase [Gemmatimonadaceae bacterium]
MTRLPGRLVLLGHPVAHSLSPVFQNAALRHLGIPLRYEALDVPPEELTAALDTLIAERAAGNVTLPHKERVAARCERLTAVARRVGAVNTFWVADDGALWGDNTDVGGFRRLLADTLPRERVPRRVAVLGAGGAAAAVLAALEEGAVPVTLYNRTAARASALQTRFPTVIHLARSAREAVHEADLVVNASSVGLRDDAVPVAIELLDDDAVVLDLVYRPGGTAWVRAARARGHIAADGLGMLLEQGALAFERWLGVPAPREVMRAAAVA